MFPRETGKIQFGHVLLYGFSKLGQPASSILTPICPQYQLPTCPRALVRTLVLSATQTSFWVTFTFRVAPAPIDRLVILCRSGLLKISLLNIKTLLSGVTMSAKSCPQEIFLFLGYLKGIHHRMVSFLTLSVLSNPIVKLGYYAVIFKLGLNKNQYL